MNCPRCSTILNKSMENGIEIDFCPNCKSEWLDAEELETYIEHPNAYGAPLIGEVNKYGHQTEHYINRDYKLEEHNYNEQQKNKIFLWIV